MDPQTVNLVKEWQETLTPQERELHELAAIMLKKSLKPKDMPEDKDNGSYYVEKCHAFKSWLKTKNTKK